MSTNEDKAAIKYVEPSYESYVETLLLAGRVLTVSCSVGDLDELARDWELERRVINIALEGTINNNRGPLGPQPHPVAVTMPSNIGSAFTSQKKRKYSSEYSETVTNPEEPVLKRIRSDNYQIGFIYSAAGVYPVEDVGSAELREWTEDVCSH